MKLPQGYSNPYSPLSPQGTAATATNVKTLSAKDKESTTNLQYSPIPVAQTAGAAAAAQASAQASAQSSAQVAAQGQVAPMPGPITPGMPLLPGMPTSPIALPGPGFGFGFGPGFLGLGGIGSGMGGFGGMPGLGVFGTFQSGVG